jgi:hypothetical protein
VSVQPLTHDIDTDIRVDKCLGLVYVVVKSMTIDQLFSFIPYAAIALTAVVGGVLYARFRRGEGLIASLESREFVTLKILVPKNNEKGPLAAEQMFAALHGIFREKLPAQEHIALEVASDGRTIQFYAYVPRHFQDYLESQIYAQYPEVEITEVPDYTAIELSSERQAAGAVLQLAREEFFPIKTFPNFEVDPLAAVTAVLSNVPPGLQIWVQFLLEPANDSWQKKAIDYIKAVKKGINLNGGGFSLGAVPGAIGRMATGLASEIVSQAVYGPPKPEEKKEKPAEAPSLSGPEEQGIKGIETKVTKLGFKTLIRIVAVAPDFDRARAKVLNVVGAFKQFNISNLNGFTAPEVTSDRTVFDEYRKRSMPDGYVLNTEELASIFHLPHTSVETPAIAWAGSKKSEPPQNLPIEGSVDPYDITLFGETNFRHLNQRFGMRLADRRFHTYSIGKTGTGKSTLIENMALDDIYKGRGVAVVDPHGDLIKRVLARIPSHRINDVVYFNPADREHPVAFNLLENVEQDLKGIVASGLMSIFTKLWANVWSARMEYILRNTLLAALDYPDSTLLSVMKILNDPVYRRHVIAKTKDPVIKDFFLNEFEKYDPKFRQEAIAPIQNKVGQFLSSATMRNILGQPHSTIDFEEIMNNGKVLLVNLSVGEIGEDASALLGGMVITKIQLSAMRRATVKEEQRKDFYLYVDEFQNFATDSFAVILSEARKYRLNLFLTNQFIAQMPETVKNAVFGNVGTVISFRVGPGDAGALVKEFEPVFDANDLVNLANYQIYLKMTIDGVTSVPFSATTLPPIAAETGNEEKIVRTSRERYSRPREFVETKIAEWSELWENIAREEARAEKERKRFAREQTRFGEQRRPGVAPHREPRREERGFEPHQRVEKSSERAGERQPPAPPEKIADEKKVQPSAPRYIPPPPVRPMGKSEPEAGERKGAEQKPEAQEAPAVSPSIGEARFVEPVTPKPLIQPHEVPQEKKERFKIPAFGSRKGDIVPLQEGEEIRLDE